MAWLPDVPVGEVGSSSTFFPVPNISNVVGGGFVEKKDENYAFYDDIRKRDVAKVKITKIHHS